MTFLPNQNRTVLNSTFHSIPKIFLVLNNELKKNFIAYFLPLPILLIGWIFFIFNGNRPFSLNATGVGIYIAGLFFIALVYGLQCFSSEADRKTLDFLLTKPISPIVLLSVKYFLSLSIFMGWFLLSQPLLITDLSKLGLPKEMSFEWILLIIVMVHAMSCLSGLLAKGLERLFAILVITGGVAGISYFLWWRFFKLMQANYYLPDVPPNLNSFVMTTLPVIFSIMGIQIPFIGTLWLMKSREKLGRFKPAFWSFGIWVFAYLVLLLSENIFSPVLWPNKTAKYGDWHEKAGIVLTGPRSSKFEFLNTSLKNQRVDWNMTLSYPGHRPKVIYQGYNLYKPKFSPDGRKIVFSEDNILKILDLQSNHIEKIGPGAVAGWSQSGEKLICSQIIGKKSLSRLYIYDDINKTKKYIPGTYSTADLVWNSDHDTIYLFEYQCDLKLLNLKTYHLTKIEFENKNIFPFGIFPPNTAYYSPLNKLFFGQVIGRRLLYYFVDSTANKVLVDEEKMDFRIKSGAPMLICSKPTFILWPRIDGGFVYQTTNLNIGIHHHHSKEEGHHHDD